MLVPSGVPLVVACTGHRPDGLGITYDLRTWVPMIRRLMLAYWIPLSVTHSQVTVISGMALGWDLMVADAALDARDAGFPVKLVCAVPFAGQEKKWRSQDTITWYHNILDQADEVVTVSPGGFSAAKMQIRNQWMVDTAFDAQGMVLAAWNGSPGGTGNCMQYALAKRYEDGSKMHIHNAWLEFFGPAGVARQSAPPPLPPASAQRKRAA